MSRQRDESPETYVRCALRIRLSIIGDESRCVDLRPPNAWSVGKQGPPTAGHPRIPTRGWPAFAQWGVDSHVSPGAVLPEAYDEALRVLQGWPQGSRPVDVTQVGMYVPAHPVLRSA